MAIVKSLSETSVFQATEKMGNLKITETLKKITDVKSGTIYLEESQLEDVFYKMRHKSFNFSAKFAVIDLFKKGVIKLIYNEHQKLTVAVPYFKCQLPTGGFGVIVNVSQYARMRSDGTVYIDELVLYTLMLSAAFSIVIDSYVGILNSTSIPELYASMMVTTFGRISSIDMTKRDIVRFVFTKFLHMQLGVNELRASTAAASCCKGLDKYAAEQIDLKIPTTAYANLQTIIAAFHEAFPEISGIDFPTVFDRWIRSFGEASAFAIEYIPYFITIFCALVANCNNIVNVKAIEKEANRHSSKLVMLFNKIENVVSEMAK